MGRFLIVVPPLVGHTNPTVPLGRELERRGHAVAWSGHRDVVAGLLPSGATFLPAADRVLPEVEAAMDAHLAKGSSGIANFTALWSDFAFPTARQMIPGVLAAVDRFEPDVVVADEHAMAGAVAAELRGLPWATSATSSGDLIDPLDAVPKVAAWLRDGMAEVLTEAGVDPARARDVDTRFSPHLVLAFTAAELVGDTAGLPDHYAFVGPSFEDRPDDTPFPWDWLEEHGPGADRPTVLVTLGTVNQRAGERFFGVAIDALRGMDVAAVVVAPPDLVPDPPAHVLVLPRVPQVALLPHVSAVLCHGGHNTVCESLAHGVPLVVAAVRSDQPIIAEQVVRAGAGVRVKFARVTVPMLQHALQAVLTDPVHRAGATRMQAALATAGGPPEAADRLEALLKVSVP
jgi:MGT family glycosyltransferase